MSLFASAYKTGTPESFAQALQMAADEDNSLPQGVKIRDIIDSWSTKPGLPVVTITRDYENNTATVTQVPLFEMLLLFLLKFWPVASVCDTVV